MDLLDELIGFLIIVFLFVFPLIRRALMRKAPQKPPESRPQEVSPPRRAPPPPPVKPFIATTPQTVRRDFDFHYSLEEYTTATKIESRQVGTRVQPKFKEKVTSEAYLPVDQGALRRTPKPVKRLLQRDPLKAMVVLHEIFEPPKGLR